MKTKAVLGLILLLGLFLRAFFVTKLPLYGDELTMVEDSYSILKTGLDQTGARLPLTFKMGAGRPGGYIYFSIPFVAVFGPTAFGVRSLSLLSGVGIILLMYFLGRKLFGEKAGVAASLLTAISPWDIYLSRGGFEAHFALFLALAGITAFFYKKYFWWAVAWGIAIFTYPTFKLTLPLIFVLLALLEGAAKLFRNKIFLISLFILLIFGAGAASQTFIAGSEQRFLSENIFADKNLKELIIQHVNYERHVSTLPLLLKPVFINRGIEYARNLLDNYMGNISPSFLVLRGDGNPRHNPGEMGMLYLVDLPLILISLVFLWKERRREFFLLLVWVLITPLATMFFPEAHALRNTLMLPPLILAVAYVFTKLPKGAVTFASLMIFVQLIYILVRVYTIAPAKFGSFWNVEAERASLAAIKDQARGKVILSTKKIDAIEYAYPVYAKIDPRLVIEQYGKFPKVYGNVVITDE
jgi:4-amino-4-deoxy-L-arabinose transferase-like glycosyltransferase